MFTQVSRVTGIASTLLRNERPLSFVMPMFLEWVATTTSYIGGNTKIPHYPGIMELNVILFIII